MPGEGSAAGEHPERLSGAPGGYGGSGGSAGCFSPHRGPRGGGPPAGQRRTGRVGLRPGYVPHGGTGSGRREGGAALQPVQPGLERTLVVERGGQQHPGADQLDLEPWRGRPAHLREPLVDQVGGTAQLGGAEDGGLRLHPLDHVGGGVDEPLVPGVRHRGEDHQVTQPLQQIGHEATGVVTALDHPVHDLEGRRPVAGREGVHDRVQQGPVRVPEERGRHGIGHTVLARTGQQLVHHGHRVTDGTRAGPHDERQHTVLDRAVLLAAHLGEVAPQRPGGHQPERVVVRTRPNRADDLLGLGGREDELQMLRRLLDHLQQGVEPRRGDHVGLVDDVDLVPARRGPEERLLPQVTGVVHTTVRGGVDLDHIDRTRSVARQVTAGPALPARRRRRALLAVQTAREDAGAGRLPTPARPAEQVRVVDPVVPQGLLQGVSDMLLTDDLGEGLGAIAAVQRKGRHIYEVIGAHRQPAPPPKTITRAHTPGHARAPHAPARADLPLLPSGPGGVQSDSAT